MCQALFKHGKKPYCICKLDYGLRTVKKVKHNKIENEQPSNNRKLPGGAPGSKQKKIPLSINCSKATYDQRRKQNGVISEGGEAEFENGMSLTSKYQLLPADYSPPTLSRRENFSAISGPALPSGPHLPGTHTQKVQLE